MPDNDPSTPDDGGVPLWLSDATSDVLMVACAAVLWEDQDEAWRELVDSLRRFGDAVSEHPEHSEAISYLTLAGSMVRLCANDPTLDPEGDGPTVVQLVDSTTGMQIGDPDEDVADDPHAKAMLAAVRAIAALKNGDKDTSWAIIDGYPPDEFPRLVLTLARMAGPAVLHKARADGELPPDTLAKLDQAEARDRDARPPLPEPVVREGPDGIRLVSVPTPDLDSAGVALAMPHGAANYALSIYVPGITGHRAKIVAGAHRQIVATPSEGDLCGVEHSEDAEPWQLPGAFRTQINRAMRAATREAGRPVQLVRCWQHTTACPESLSDEDRARIPTDTDVPLFDAPADGGAA